MNSEIDRAIERHADSAFAFLEQLVAAPSTLGSEQAALDVFARELDSVGLVVSRLPFDADTIDDPRAGVAQEPSPPAHRYQALAVTPGSGPLALLLNGHIDVVPATDADLWSSAPFTPVRRRGQLYGRGAGDMKGGFAIGVLALRALRDVVPDLFSSRRLGFVAVIEEECTGNGTLRSIIEQGVIADEVVLLEPTDLGLLIGGVGVLWVDVEIIGVAAHASDAASAGNAIELGMQLVGRLRGWAASLVEDYPPSVHLVDGSPYNLNLGTIRAGDWNSSSPSTATLGMRIAYPTAWSPERAEREVRAKIAAVVSEDSSFPSHPIVRMTGFRAAGYEIDPEHPLVRDLAAAHQDAHGTAPKVFTLGSTTDARTYVNEFDTPAVCYGAVAHRMHGVDESVELESIVGAARTLARFLLLRFAANGSES